MTVSLLHAPLQSTRCPHSSLFSSSTFYSPHEFSPPICHLFYLTLIFSVLYSVLFGLPCMQYGVSCTRCSVLCTLYSVLCTRYSVLCTLYSVLCTLHLLLPSFLYVGQSVGVPHTRAPHLPSFTCTSQLHNQG